MRKTDDPAFAPRRFDHIECDVEGCGIEAPTPRELAEQHKNLLELGWFIGVGMHRCPKHFHEDVPGRGVEVRDA